MKQDNSKWVDDVLNSAVGIASASPRADLYDQLRARLGSQLPRVKRIPLAAIPAAAACLLVLFALNFTAVSKYARTMETGGTPEVTTVQDIVDYYDLSSNNAGL